MAGFDDDIEKTIYKCPVMDKDTEMGICPPPSEERLMLLSLKCDPGSDPRQVFGSVRTDVRGEEYIEIIFYHEDFFLPESYRSFVIRRGFMMPDDEEAFFFYLCDNAKLRIDVDDFVLFQEAFAEYCPDIPVRAYDDYEIGEYLKRIYLSTHACGPREILYKAGLDRVASYIREVEDYNLIGSSPEEILSMPVNLIRVLERNGLDEYIKSSQLRKKAYEAYRRFSSYFGKDNYPNRFQVIYIIECASWGEQEKRSPESSLNETVNGSFCGAFGGSFAGSFNKRLYRKLRQCRDSREYFCYKRYTELALELGKHNPYKKIPDSCKIVIATEKMETIAGILAEKDELDKGIAACNDRGYKYEDDDMFVKTPLCVLDILNESRQQNSCLNDYAGDVAEGNTNIVFVRRKRTPDRAYITVEIRMGRILQVRAKNNALPERKGWEFIERFAEANLLEYDPEDIMYSDGWCDNVEDDDDLIDYLNKYKERYIWPPFPESGIKGMQMNLWECFPESFP